MLRRVIWSGVIAAALSAMPAAAQTDKPVKLTVFVDPSPNFAGAWVAEAKGYFKEVGLDVDLKQAVSGTSALQAYKVGAADIAYAGELPAMNYWVDSKKTFKFIAVVNRNTRNQAAIVSKSIRNASDLKGKKIGTRVGSTSSWFLSEYLKKNNLSPSDVSIKNLEPQLLPTALCGGDIDAFFGYNPLDLRALEICPDKVHRLTYGDGYIQSYIVFGARGEWLEKPENRKTTELFLKAYLKGEKDAQTDFDGAAAIMTKKLGLSKELAVAQWKNLVLEHNFDTDFRRDFCMLADWMKSEGRFDGALNFNDLVDARMLAALDPKADSLPARACGS